MKNPLAPENLKGKIIFWRWSNDEGAVNRSVVEEDLGEIIIISGGFKNAGLNLPIREITIFKVVDADPLGQLPRPKLPKAPRNIGRN